MLADVIARQGRMGDTQIAHVTPGEITVPPEVQRASPGLADVIARAMIRAGGDPREHVVGSPHAKVNPATGVQEHAWWNPFSWFEDDGQKEYERRLAAQRQREEAERRARERRVGQGIDNVNATFDETFNEDYFQGVSDDYLAHYNPQLQDQYDDAYSRVTQDLYRQFGNLEGTEQAGRLAELEQTFNDRRARLANEAEDRAQQSRNAISRERHSLHDLARELANPDEALSRATTFATGYQAPNQYNPLEDVFWTLHEQGKKYIPGGAGGGGGSQNQLSGLLFNGGGGGSASIVGA